MKTQKFWLPIVFAFAVVSASGCHKTDPASQVTRPPVADIQKTKLDYRTWQINQSNLPPDQKQRLINQIHASGAK